MELLPALPHWPHDNMIRNHLCVSVVLSGGAGVAPAVRVQAAAAGGAPPAGESAGGQGAAPPQPAQHGQWPGPPVHLQLPRPRGPKGLQRSTVSLMPFIHVLCLTGNFWDWTFFPPSFWGRKDFPENNLLNLVQYGVVNSTKQNKTKTKQVVLLCRDPF